MNHNNSIDNSKNENLRLETLFNYEILDTAREEDLDLITQLASSICNTPISLISLVDDKRQWFKSKVGLDADQTPREISFCQHAIKHNDIFIVHNSLLDERFANNPLVLGDPNIRFYAGMPLSSPNGCNLGTLCVIDTKPRSLTKNQIESLKALSKYVIHYFELRKNNKKLQEFNRIAEEMQKAKDEFFSNMNHELRTPLNAIFGFSDLLLKTNLNKEQKEMAHTIKSSCEVLITLINDILDLTKLESCKVQLESIPFNIKETVKNIYNLLKIKVVDNNGVYFNLFIDPSVPDVVIGDKVRLHQIIVNLVGNALKFTSKGSVDLKVKVESQSKEDVTLNFSVSDTGIGIPQDKLSSIFNRFEQASSDTTRKFGGTGLGLNISKRLVELQGGTLNLQSEINKGSEFSFSLAYVKSSDEEKKEERNELSETQSMTFNNKKILVFEDNDLNFKLLSKVFEKNKKGLTLTRAEDGRVGIDILRKEKFDLIFMDLYMPVIGGYDATRIIRKELKLPTPIIAMTANDSATEKNQCLDSGMNDYLSKPFKPEDLFKKMSQFLTAAPTRKRSARHYTNYDDIIDIKHVNLLMQYEESLKIINRRKIKQTPQKIKFNNKSPDIARKNEDNINSDKIYFKQHTASPELKQIINRNITDKRKIILNHCKSLDVVNTSRFNFKNKSIEEKEFETVNFDVLKEYFGEDQEIQREMVEIFLKENKELMRKLESAIKENNSECIKLFAHSIKSQVAMLGLDNMRKQLIEIESNTKERNLDLIFQDIQMVIENVYKQLSRFINKN